MLIKIQILVSLLESNQGDIWHTFLLYEAFLQKIEAGRRDAERNQSHFWYMDQEVIIWIFLGKLIYIGRKALSELLQIIEQPLNRTSLGE